MYKDITLGETGKDIKANLKLYSNRTDMLKDDYSGTTWKQYLAEFNEMYPNIKISIEGGTDYANSSADPSAGWRLGRHHDDPGR